MPTSVGAVGTWWAGLGAASQATVIGAGVAAAGTAATIALAPKPGQVQLPGLPQPVAMPDPLQQEQARQRSIAESLARRGRASTILTQDTSDKLGA